MKSNLWPGAYSFSYGDFADSIYFGWGQKYVSRNYTPPHVSQIQNEYPYDVLEAIDPTPELEEWRLAHLPPPKDAGDEFGEEIEEEVDE